MDRWLVFCAWLRLVVIASAVGAAASTAGEVLIGGGGEKGTGTNGPGTNPDLAGHVAGSHATSRRFAEEDRDPRCPSTTIHLTQGQCRSPMPQSPVAASQ